MATRGDHGAPVESLSRLGASHAAAIFVILAFAFLLRVWGLAAHLPYAVGVDEPEIMGRVVRMMKTGDFNPHFFDWPSLSIYLNLAVACAVFLGGAMRGAWHGLTQVGAADFYIYGRAVTAILGTATVAVLFAAARRWGVATALLAAAMLAVAPDHTRESHYVLADVPTTFFTTLALLMSLRLLERPSARACALAGLTVGLAASCKYNGSMAVVLPVIAACAAGGWSVLTLQWLLIVGGCTVAGFLVGTPYAVLDLPKFLNDYARLASVFARERAGEPGWSLYLKYLRQSLGWVGLAAATVGLFLTMRAVATGPARARALMLTGFTIVYFSVMSTSYQIYGRYSVPLLPFVALLASVATVSAVGVLRPRLSGRLLMAVVLGLVLLLVTPPAIRAIDFDRQAGRVSTIDLAWRWIDSHVSPGAVIVSETYPMLLASTRYRISNVPPLSGKTFEQYTADGVDYVLVSSVGYDAAFKSPEQHPEAYAAYTSLLKQSREVATFAGSEEVRGPGLKLLQIKEAPAPSR